MTLVPIWWLNYGQLHPSQMYISIKGYLVKNSTTTSNTLNLHSGAFLSADEGVSIVPLNEPLAVRLMSATGSKLADKSLKTTGNGAYYIASILDPNGNTVWANIPTAYPFIKWSGNDCWVLLKPEATTMTEAEWNSL